MAELTPQERLQPSLLDRLTDDAPHQQQESREERVLSMTRLRQCVLRDLAWLLNAGNLASLEESGEYPYVQHSIINYGLPEMAGRVVYGPDTLRLERLIRRVIEDFEPRILRHTLQVRAIVADKKMSQSRLSFEIEGELWAQPTPLHLYLKTEVDLDTGKVALQDVSGRGPG